MRGYLRVAEDLHKKEVCGYTIYGDKPPYTLENARGKQVDIELFNGDMLYITRGNVPLRLLPMVVAYFNSKHKGKANFNYYIGQLNGLRYKQGKKYLPDNCII